MLRSLKAMLGYDIACTDDRIGQVKDFLFDDKDWVVRYMVADTSKWLPGRKVVLSPVFLKSADWETSTFSVNLSHEQVKNAPPLDDHMPVSREYEKHFSDYHGYPYYWVGSSGIWGMGSRPFYLMNRTAEEIRKANKEKAEIESSEEANLRSVKEVSGYDINAADKEIGHVEDYIVNDESWEIRYIVVDTRNWLPGGKKVLVAKNWITHVSWNHRNVYVELDSEAVKNSPEFDPNLPINRSFEIQVYDFYGRPYDW